MDDERVAQYTIGAGADEMKTATSGELKLDLHQEPSSGASGGMRQATDVVVDVMGRSEVVRDRPARQLLTKDQLMTEYADKCSWVALRWSLLGLFIVCWFVMLAAAVAIIFMTPGCAPRVRLEWWQSAVVYQVDVQSFQDADGDGVGDLLGVLSFMLISSLNSDQMLINFAFFD